MFGFILRRVLGMVLTLYIILTLSFLMMRLAPGGPFSQDRKVPPAIEQALKRKYNLDQPIHRQYTRFMGQIFHGDLGVSMAARDQPVTDIIRQLAPQTLRIGVLALIFSIVAGIGLGVLSALNQNTSVDYGAMAFALLGISTPTFVLAYYLIQLFAVRLGWFNPGGLNLPSDYILPSFCLAVPFIAVIARLSRAGMLEVLSQDYILTAKAKGVGAVELIMTHALKGALLPVVSYLGPAAAGILVGGVVVEQVFAIDGIGPELVKASLARDYPMVIGLVIVYSTFLVAFNLLADIAYGFLDPRVRLEEA